MNNQNVLEMVDVHSYYGQIHALKGISLTVKEGEIVTLIGSNGAGKSTTLRTISGLLAPRSGSVKLRGTEIGGIPAHKVAEMGVAQSPEGRRIFPRMTVLENLQMGAFVHKKVDPADLDRVFELFPRLKERVNQNAGTMSGGEQQMLAIGRALMANPRVLLLDEPSLGLAPVVVEQVFDLLRRLHAEGVSMLLVEQNARMALAVADRAYVLQTGRIVMSGAAAELAASDEVRARYLGAGRLSTVPRDAPAPEPEEAR